MSLEFSPQVLEKYPNIKAQENPSSGAEMFHADKRTGRHDETNNLFAQFCHRS
jgi:hypothetical protein